MTLPYCQHAPTVGLQGSRMFQIPDPRACKFWFPISKIGFGQTSNRAIRIRMPVPEATVDEYHCAAARKNQVRLAWHTASMQSETIPEAMHH